MASRSASDPSARARFARHALLLIATAVLSALLVTRFGQVPTEPLQVGDVAPRTVKAPFTFTYQDLDTWESLRDRAASDEPPVFLYDAGLVPELTERVATAFRTARRVLSMPDELPDGVDAKNWPPPEVVGQAQLAFVEALEVRTPADDVGPLAKAVFPEAAEAAFVQWLQSAYGERLVVDDRGTVPVGAEALTIVPRVGDQPPFEVSDLERIVEPDTIRNEITVASVNERDSGSWGKVVREMARAMVRSNLTYDEARTAAAREEARAGVELAPVVVQHGETLFREGDKISALDLVRYKALQASRADDGVLMTVLASAVFVLLVLGSLYAAMWRAFRGPDGGRDLGALLATILATVMLARVVTSSAPGIADLLGNDASPESVWFLVPVAGGAMLVRILMGSRRAAFYALGASTIVGLLMQNDARYVVFFLLTSLVGGVLVQRMRERITVLQAGAWVGGFAAAAVVALHFVELYGAQGELSLAVKIRPFWSMAFAVGGGILSGFFVLAVIPIFESVGFVTDHRMLELASLNHPLMRQLMLRAPGTYHHSVIVGTLAEAACTAIGANALQAKIAAYFHDIGKALKPRYFVENQRGGPNPHGELDPERSAAIIIEHVTEGYRMAREHKLPQPILDNIRMHHGTGLLQYFFAKAQMEADDPADVDETAYRYPGPKPSTREAGVVMLADKVEAATRTIQQPTEENIRAMINRIINSVIADHQFTECPLTFQEIHTIADTFVTVLVGIYHQRIEYPQTAGISKAPASLPPGEVPQVGTITLELESRRVAGEEASHLWNEDALDHTDETTDYESVRNLPQGEL